MISSRSSSGGHSSDSSSNIMFTSVHMCLLIVQAEEFQEVVTIMREFLPEAEAQLKLRSLPDDEVVILQMIEKHEVRFCLVMAGGMMTLCLL